MFVEYFSSKLFMYLLELSMNVISMVYIYSYLGIETVIHL